MPPAPAAYLFGPFRLEGSERRLWRQEQPVRLAPKAFDTLLLLVSRAGSLVTRDVLLETVWGGAYVEEANVTHAIWQLRRALDDGSGEERYIETVPRAGYRFVAPVEEVAGDAAGAESPLPAAPGPRGPGGQAAQPPSGAAFRPLTRSPGRALLIALAVLLIVVVAALGLRSRRAGPPQPGVAIAVLPFEPIGESEDRRYLTDGLTEEVVAALGQLDPARLSVVGRTSTLGYRGSREPFSRIGRELGVDYLVDGTTRSERGQLRVTARLVRVSDQVQVWSGAFDRRLTSALRVQQELSVAIAEEVRLRLMPEVRSARARRQTQSAEAYDLYLRGRYLWNRFTPATNARALDYYQRATAIDPSYALAWAGIALVLGGSPINSDVPPDAVLPRAREAAERAARLEPTLAEGHTALGAVKFFGWDFAGAEGSLRRAIELDPSAALPRLLLGHVLSQRGRHEEGVEEMERARRLEPFFPMTHALSSQVAYQAGDAAAALEHAQRAVAIDGQFWIGYVMMGQGQELLGRPAEALESFSTAAQFSNGNSKALAMRAHVLGTLGRTGEAREVLATLQAASRERFVPPSSLAMAYVGLARRDEALDALEAAHAARDVQLIFLPVDPRWDPLRSDPRFTALLRRCGFTR